MPSFPDDLTGLGGVAVFVSVIDDYEPDYNSVYPPDDAPLTFNGSWTSALTAKRGAGGGVPLGEAARQGGARLRGATHPPRCLTPFPSPPLASRADSPVQQRVGLLQRVQRRARRQVVRVYVFADPDGRG